MARGEKNRATIRSAVLTLAWQENVVYTNQQLQTLRQSASSWPVLWRPTIGHPRSAGTAGTLRTYSWGYGAVVAHLPCMQGVRGSNPLSSTRQNVPCEVRHARPHRHRECLASRPGQRPEI